MRFAIVSGSLSPKGGSALLAGLAEGKLRSMGHETDFVDLREHALPFGGAPGSFSHPAVVELAARLERADGFLLASPVYNYDVNAALKNLVEVAGKAFSGKAVGILLSAGGHASYMSAMGIANSLMLDFRCVIVPRFVYAVDHQHIVGGKVEDEDILKRVDELAEQLVRLSAALKAP